METQATTTCEAELLDLVRRNGKGILELSVKMRRLLDRAEAPPAASAPDLTGLLTDLVEGLDRAIEEVRRLRAPGGENAAIGIEVLRRRVLEALEAEGLFPVKARGRFRPRAHQVVSTVPGAPPGEIVGVARRGWARRKGNEVVLVRPALVVVGARRDSFEAKGGGG